MLMDANYTFHVLCLFINYTKKCSIAYFPSAGQDVVLVKSGRRICGSGAGLANAPIAQNKAYYEVKLQSTGWLLIDVFFV